MKAIGRIAASACAGGIHHAVLFCDGTIRIPHKKLPGMVLVRTDLTEAFWIVADAEEEGAFMVEQIFAMTKFGEHFANAKDE